MPAKKTYTLENISDIKLFQTEIEVDDRDTGETKIVKTVNRAEIATIVAYMLGIDDEVMQQYYSHRYGNLLDKLYKDKNATIIRYLSKIRTALFKNFLNIDNKIRFELMNLDRMEYFSAEEIKQLAKWGINVIQPNYRAERYSEHLCSLIDQNINKCGDLFPEQIKFEYIRDLFVVPNFMKKGILKDEYDKYKANKAYYPFQVYMYWEPCDSGNILYSDAKLLGILYSQHGDTFVEWYKYRDAADDTKDSIYDFIRNSQKVVLVVDCENSDAYKLFGVLKNLKTEDVQLIERIILYDDYHTTNAWDYLEQLVDIPVEHIEVDRVTDAKSLVDIEMAVGVCKAFYRDNVDSFILCSSDSDFWGLISSIPEARFLVMYEYAKCGSAIKEALSSRNIFHCAMDDFFMENAGELQQIVLCNILDSHLPNIIGEDGWELTRRIFAEAYIPADDIEMRRFYEKYVKSIKLKIGSDGRFYLAREKGI